MFRNSKHVCDYNHPAPSVTNTAPNWKENIVCTWNQYDERNLTGALNNVLDCRMKIKQINKAILQKIKHRDMILDPYEETLRSSLLRFQSRSNQTIKNDDVSVEQVEIHNPEKNIHPRFFLSQHRRPILSTIDNCSTVPSMSGIILSYGRTSVESDVATILYSNSFDDCTRLTLCDDMTDSILKSMPEEKFNDLLCNNNNILSSTMKKTTRPMFDL